MALVAEDFIAHPLDFFTAVIIDNDEIRVRVHIWLTEQNKQYSKPLNETHSHSFDLFSNVLIGVLSTSVFNFKHNKASEGETVKEFEVKYKNGLSSLEETGREGVLIEDKTFVTKAGGEYFLEHGQIHVAKIISTPCVTITKMIKFDVKSFSYGTVVDELPSNRNNLEVSTRKEIQNVLDSIRETLDSILKQI